MTLACWGHRLLNFERHFQDHCKAFCTFGLPFQSVPVVLAISGFPSKHLIHQASLTILFLCLHLTTSKMLPLSPSFCLRESLPCIPVFPSASSPFTISHSFCLPVALLHCPHPFTLSIFAQYSLPLNHSWLSLYRFSFQIISILANHYFDCQTANYMSSTIACRRLLSVHVYMRYLVKEDGLKFFSGHHHRGGEY